KNTVDSYLAKPLRKVDKPLEWWIAYAKQFLQFTKIVFNFLSILAMSSEYKRVFSYAKHCVSYQRYTLYVDLINIL
ncbi:uncharacterized protein THITE_2059183, partial [Thermothielavioides terrestris NRRL 8126]